MTSLADSVVGISRGLTQERVREIRIDSESQAQSAMQGHPQPDPEARTSTMDSQRLSEPKIRSNTRTIHNHLAPDSKPKSEPSHAGPTPNARRRYHVSLDTRFGDKRIELHNHTYQQQSSTEDAPLRLYHNPSSPDIPCALPALQQYHPLPQNTLPQWQSQPMHTDHHPPHPAQPTHIYRAIPDPHGQHVSVDPPVQPTWAHALD